MNPCAMVKAAVGIIVLQESSPCLEVHDRHQENRCRFDQGTSGCNQPKPTSVTSESEALAVQAYGKWPHLDPRRTSPKVANEAIRPSSSNPELQKAPRNSHLQASKSNMSGRASFFFSGYPFDSWFVFSFLFFLRTTARVFFIFLRTTAGPRFCGCPNSQRRPIRDTPPKPRKPPGHGA